jgi:uncharacterized RDD family membrane protein YckC
MPANAIFCQKCGASMGPGLAAGGTPATQASNAFIAVVQPYGGFWIRVLAYLIDGLIEGAILSPLFIVLGLRIAAQFQHGAPNSIEDFMPIFQYEGIIVLAGFLVQWLYEALLTSSSWQATVGKRVLNLKVTDEQGNRISFQRATGRVFGKILSGMIFDIGFIMVAFTQRKQGLHDMMAGTLVMKVDP